MSRSSPGRYAVHEFAKNVFSVEAYDDGRAANHGRRGRTSMPGESRGHNGTVRVVYKIFGDHADGTYMGVDTTHAHLNMPATFMWARGPRDAADLVTVRAAGRFAPGRSARS